MPNVVKITVEAPDEILNPGAYGAGAIVRLQSAATEAGAFADVSGTGSTPTTAVTTGIRSYTAYDPTGTSSTWYRTRFENVGATRLSDWSAAFQVGGEDAGLICSLYDVKQRLDFGEGDTDHDEEILGIIGQVGSDIMGYTGRRFVRSPLNGTTTYLFDVEISGRTLWIPKGIAEMSQLEVATQSQPESGGTYTVVPAADWFLRPTTADRDFGWPATRVVITDQPTGSMPIFYAGYNVVRATMALGWASVPGDIRGISEHAVVRRWQAKQSGQADIVGTSEFGSRLLRFIAPEEREKLDWYRVVPV